MEKRECFLGGKRFECTGKFLVDVELELNAFEGLKYM